MLTYANTMARYNRWMNRRLYGVCGELSDEARKRDMGAFFRSIHGTLNHLLLVDRLWMGRFTGEGYSVQSLDQELYADFDTLRAEREQEDDRILAWVAALDQETIEGDLVYTSAINPEPRRIPFQRALIHFFNHQTHHRGQLTTLIFQQGIDPGVTDLMWLPEGA